MVQLKTALTNHDTLIWRSANVSSNVDPHICRKVLLADAGSFSLVSEGRSRWTAQGEAALDESGCWTATLLHWNHVSGKLIQFPGNVRLYLCPVWRLLLWLCAHGLSFHHEDSIVGVYWVNMQVGLEIMKWTWRLSRWLNCSDEHRELLRCRHQVEADAFWNKATNWDYLKFLCIKSIWNRLLLLELSQNYLHWWKLQKLLDNPGGWGCICHFLYWQVVSISLNDKL